MDGFKHDEFWLSLARRWLLIGSVAYVLWGFSIRWTVPGAYDPWHMRCGVSAYFILVCAYSYMVSGKRSLTDPVLTSATCLVVAHYYYLFYRNGFDPNWFAGAYITVVAAAASIFSSTQLAAYSIFVMMAGAVLVASMPELVRSSFLPGMATVLAFINFALRGRTRWNDEHVAAEAARVETRMAEDELRVRDEYVAIISHELKTPVTSVKLRTQMLLRKLAQDPGQPVAFERVQRFARETDLQVARLISLVEDMLDLSRVTNGKLSLQHEPISFSEVVEGALNSLEDTFSNAGCALNHDIVPNVVVHGDRRRLEQVVLNLLTNAIKYGRGTPVDVTLTFNGDEAELRVRDRGLGVAKRDQQRIFARFERAISARNVSGLGLGLFICHEIVAAHKGHITLESDLGKGACFTVTLPGCIALVTETPTGIKRVKPVQQAPAP